MRWKNFTINFNRKAYQVISRLSKKCGISKAEVLRNAIAIYDFAIEKKREGYKIATYKDGETREIVID